MVNETMDECERLTREIFGGTDPVERPLPTINTQPLVSLRDIWPEVVERLRNLLTESGELDLAASVDSMHVYDRCRCGADHCATVYTRPRPSDRYGPTHRNVVFWDGDTIDLDTGIRVGDTSTAPTTQFTTILDVVDDQIMCIEILDDQESRRRLIEALPGLPEVVE
jgi:hypothetical protein